MPTGQRLSVIFRVSILCELSPEVYCSVLIIFKLSVNQKQNFLAKVSSVSMSELAAISAGPSSYNHSLADSGIISVPYEKARINVSKYTLKHILSEAGELVQNSEKVILPASCLLEGRVKYSVLSQGWHKITLEPLKNWIGSLNSVLLYSGHTWVQIDRFQCFCAIGHNTMELTENTIVPITRANWGVEGCRIEEPQALAACGVIGIADIVRNVGAEHRPTCSIPVQYSNFAPL